MGTNANVFALFKKWDSKGDGLIDESALRGVLEALGLECPVVSRIFREADYKSDGMVQYDDFLRWLLQCPAGREAEAVAEQSTVIEVGAQKLFDSILLAVAKAKRAGMEWMLDFEAFDADGDGCLTLTEFRKGLEALGLDFSEDEASGLFGTRDWTRDGTLSMTEFKELMEGRAAKLEEAPLAIDEGMFEKSSVEGSVDEKARAVGKFARAGTVLLEEDL
eukprot:TRINITY_DN98450_c0_g1_i1.p1 TRINITY_DN98450_c0_g1~~TRINITY_DN98450_c0_g1_i1.p1  ORF type:complete len:220 (+),score=56.26 TRINITY_DN98450_c0_g1_i1:75-734(+)